jgi:hypothetical protein
LQGRSDILQFSAAIRTGRGGQAVENSRLPNHIRAPQARPSLSDFMHPSSPPFRASARLLATSLVALSFPRNFVRAEDAATPAKAAPPTIVPAQTVADSVAYLQSSEIK